MAAKTGRIDVLFKFVVHFSNFYSADQLIDILMKTSESEGTFPIGLLWNVSFTALLLMFPPCGAFHTCYLDGKPPQEGAEKYYTVAEQKRTFFSSSAHLENEKDAQMIPLVSCRPRTLYFFDC